MIRRPLSSRCGANEYRNPALVLENIAVSDMGGRLHQRNWDALVDTGADRSVVPISVCHDLGLSPFEWFFPMGFDRTVRPVRRPLYHLRILVQGIRPAELAVYGIERGNILLGRDFLKGVLLAVDGRTQVGQIGQCNVFKSALMRLLAIC